MDNASCWQMKAPFAFGDGLLLLCVRIGLTSFLPDMKDIKMYKNLFILICMVAGIGDISAQAQHKINLEDIWSRHIFDARTIPGFNFMADGRHYTLQVGQKIEAYDITTGTGTETIFDPAKLPEGHNYEGHLATYTFSSDESQILLATNRKPIYRRSYLADFYIYNRKSGQISRLFPDGQVMNAHFSPDGEKVGFVYQNNLYIRNLSTGKIHQITHDGEENAIIHGAADWVYEEEFAITRTFEWSNDSRYLAWIRFDERAVPEFTMTNYTNGFYPEYVTFKYPKVGETNATVSVHLWDSKSGKTRNVDILTSETDLYIPRIKWTRNPDLLTVYVLNRHQNHLKLLQIRASNLESSILMEETNPYYLDITDDLTFLNDDQGFIWTSEKGDKNQIFLYDFEGNVKKLTDGTQEVTAVYGYDPIHKTIYFQATDDSPLRRAVFSVSLDGKTQKLTGKELSGWNSAKFSTTFDYYVLTHATANTPPVYTVYSRNGKKIRDIETNQSLRQQIRAYDFQPKEFFTFTIDDGTELNGYMIKPGDFDPEQEYPVFMFLYGGPGSQQVVDNWQDRYQPWFQMLVQKGYIIACVDNRGTGGRGEEFKKMTYLNLGKLETVDQIAAAKYLGGLSYVNADRIGVFGWSYGGYMSTNLLLHGNDVFSMAVAVAPVTNWRWYDTIYTERYMRTVEENEKGYRDFSPVYFADRLKGKYLLIHGISDDNVHFQHAAEMARALIDAGKDFETMYYPNDNHGIAQPTSRIHLFRLITDFIKDNL